METRLEYSSMWLGLSKVGVISALINTNLRQETLIHSICVASSKAIIVSSELLDALIEILDNEAISKLHIFVYDTKSADVKPLNGKSVNLHQELQSVSKSEVDISNCMAKDKLFYIYTSGTTGMPKAAVITNLRFQFMVSGTFMMFGLSQDEIVYNTLPLYHTGLEFVFNFRGARSDEFHFSRRNARCWLRVAVWTHHGLAKEVLSFKLLDGLHQIQMHISAIHRRALSFPSSHAIKAGRDSTQSSLHVRKWSQTSDLDTIRGTIQDRANWRSLRCN